MGNDVRIVKLDLVGGIFMWLCRKCEDKRIKKGQLVLERRPLPHAQPCQDCEHNKRR